MHEWRGTCSTGRPIGPATTDVVIGGSPLRLFRLSAAGGRHFDRLVAGDDVPPSGLVDRLLDAGAVHPAPRPRSVHRRRRHRRRAGARRRRRPPLAVPGGVRRRRRRGRRRRRSQPPIGPVEGIRLLRLRSNAGPAVARNAGLASVTTALVAFVDTDVDLGPGWLAPLLGHFEDPRVGLVAPRVAAAPAATAGPATRPTHSPLDLGPEPARIAPGTRVSYVPAAALVARTAAMRAIDGFDRRLRVGEDVDAIWRLVEAGWRCRYEPAAVVHHRTRSSWRALLAQRVAYGSSAALLARRHPGALAPVRMSGWSAGAWALLLAGCPLEAARVAAGTAVALVPKLRGVPAAESLKLAGRGHLIAGRQLADAARRVWWPALLLGSLVSRRVRRVAALAARPGAGRRRAAAVARRPQLRRRRVEGRCSPTATAPLVPDLRSWPGRRRPERSPSLRPPGRPRDGPPDGRRGALARARRQGRPPQPGADPRRQGQRLRVRPRRPGPHRRRARRRHRRRDGARAGRAAGRVDADRADAGAAPARGHAADPHRRLGPPRRGARRVAGSGGRQAGVLDAPLRHRPASLGPSPPPPGTPGSTSPPSPSTRRSPAPTTSTPTTSPRGSSCSPEDDEVWVSHLGLDGYEALVDAWPDRRFRIRRGTALWHGDKSALHLGAEVLEVRPVRAGTTAGYRQAVVPSDGWLVVIGAGSAHGIGVLADGRSPFHFDRRRLALLEPPHMHVSMAIVPAGQIGPEVGDVVDVQWPLISTSVDEVRWV